MKTAASAVKDLQESSVDTLTSSYSDQWTAMENTEQASAFVQFMSSNDLIFVVLGVSLIIWFVLLFFMIRVDKKVAKLEKTLEQDSEK
ncbi:hypothetical protein DYD21_12265 [Rhodohalobacter sp. SW132]|uniref:CcmD family protein n=1 Tax=Rhodohalobacter sp. SW132 TaxID=2293433 RepID=UPI000E2210EA|nr:hypothetical protein [Rhodohalobacter sp. SW132]REL33029.1 hypothetical protein DYD21_12265 [Rhodohalobacter sp. SW132]